MKPFIGLIRPFNGLIRISKGLIRPFKGLIGPFKGPPWTKCGTLVWEIGVLRTLPSNQKFAKIGPTRSKNKSSFSYMFEPFLAPKLPSKLSQQLLRNDKSSLHFVLFFRFVGGLRMPLGSSLGLPNALLRCLWTP